MDRTVAGLIGAVAALSAATPSQAAAPAPQSIDAALQAGSYADLLKPIPNALALIKTSETRAELLPTARAGEAPVEQAQLVVVQHHHHHRYYHRRRHYHHHHHHHHHHDHY